MHIKGLVGKGKALEQGGGGVQKGRQIPGWSVSNSYVIG